MKQDEKGLNAMRIIKPGRINERLCFLGGVESCIYLLEGKSESILINGGLSCFTPMLIRQFKEFDVDESKITKILLLHSHFDHVGTSPYLKRVHPKIDILASGRAWNVLKKPKVLQSINEANRFVMKNWNLVDSCKHYQLDWTTDITGNVVKEGDWIDLGDIRINIFETPGHSPCSISAYVPELKILFPSEAGGLPVGEKITTYGTSSYTDFEESILKLKDLEVNYICSDHYGYIAGDEAKHFIKDSIQVAKERRLFMEQVYDRTGCIDTATRELALHYNDENFLHLVPDDIFMEAHRQMLLHVIGKRTNLSI